MEPGESCRNLSSKSLNYREVSLSVCVPIWVDYCIHGKSEHRSINSNKSEILYHNLCYWECKEVWYLQKHGRVGFPFWGPSRWVTQLRKGFSTFNTHENDILLHAQVQRTWHPLITQWWGSWHYLPGLYLPENWISPKPFSASSLNRGAGHLGILALGFPKQPG